MALQRMILALCCLVLAACESSPPREVVPAAQPETKESNADKVGEYLITEAAGVWTEYDCGGSKYLPVAYLEDQQLTPQRMAAGTQFVHHFVYVLCPANPDHSITGTLFRKIYLKGRLVHSGRQSFDLRPGRWGVNAIIEVPKHSKPGTYTLQTEFIGRAPTKRIVLIKNTEFEVLDERRGSRAPIL